jgi:hypothetical protein
MYITEARNQGRFVWPGQAHLQPESAQLIETDFTMAAAVFSQLLHRRPWRACSMPAVLFPQSFISQGQLQRLLGHER